jgi:cell division protein FtsW
LAGFVIALNSHDKFARLLVIGIMSVISLQFLLNIAVVTNLIPVTGISMPFSVMGVHLC